MKDNKTCPSARCEPDSKLIGIVNQSGLVDLLTKPLLINADFITEAKKGSSPETRFRFANSCVQSGCRQWSSGSCGVIKKVLNSFDEVPTNDELPSCGIRKTCRWYSQEGGKACTVCPLVITDNESDQVRLSKY